MSNANESPEAAELVRVMALAKLPPGEIIDRLLDLAMVFATGVLKEGVEIRKVTVGECRARFEAIMKLRVTDEAWMAVAEAYFKRMQEKPN
ncbi:MAG: hypothetical protein ABSG73_01320 [Candidatus Aminicenantales bacterium]|jgi:hypothetical protein